MTLHDLDMDLFDWESAGAPDQRDSGELSELLASMQPIDAPSGLTHHFHASFSDAELLTLTTPEHDQYQTNVEQVDFPPNSNLLEWQGREVRACH